MKTFDWGKLSEEENHLVDLAFSLYQVMRKNLPRTLALWRDRGIVISEEDAAQGMVMAFGVSLGIGLNMVPEAKWQRTLELTGACMMSELLHLRELAQKAARKPQKGVGRKRRAAKVPAVKRKKRTAGA